MKGEVLVDGYSEKWLSRQFPWVYPKEVVAHGGAPSGDLVTVRGPSGKMLGRGLTDSGWLAVRMYRRDEGPLDEAWLDGILEAAELRRRHVIPANTTAWRMIHGENDDLPGIRVDHWDGWVTVVLDSPSLRRLVPLLADRLQARMPIKGIFVCFRPDSRDKDLKADAMKGYWAMGESPEGDQIITECGMKMTVRPWEGPDVGSYMDMREVRRWLAPSWQGRRVLNTFSYTGAFSVSASLHGAAESVLVDLSPHYLDRAKENFRVNGLEVRDEGFVAADTFKALDRFRRKGQLFDTIILDPPSFSHSKEGLWSAKKDYPRLVAAAARVLAPGGWLVAATNQGQVAPKEFRGHVAEGLRKAGRSATELNFFGAAPDFPAATHFPEGHYLKVGVWSVQ